MEGKIMINLLFYFSLFLIWFMLLYHMFLMYGGYSHFVNYPKKLKEWEKNVPYYPTVSVLIPAHNEEIVIEDTLEAMLKLNYPREYLEIIVINDKSSDDTGEIAERYSVQFPFIKVVNTDPEFAGKGKSAALNFGLGHSSGEVVIVYDADNTPEPDSVYYLVLGLQNDSKAGAVVGKFRVRNARKNILTRFINIETITFQWLAQGGRWFWFKLSTIPGTNFAIRRSILEHIGGWDEKALSEDTELSFRVYNLGYHIRFFPAAITWEQEPETWRVWWRQRTRWARGNQYVIAKYLFGLGRLENKRVVLDLFYFLFTYMLFLVGVLVSDILFIVNIFADLHLSAGAASIALFILAFLLYLSEVSLALSIERNQLDIKNFMMIILMYFTYSQIWLLLVVTSLFLEIGRVIFKKESKWYKTERYKQSA
jgi:cellulose synthase/poly-beta-1,6-N-acetylglucosamine synthase-like glycosyltransferase